MSPDGFVALLKLRVQCLGLIDKPPVTVVAWDLLGVGLPAESDLEVLE
jgi:hypothetical protein